MLLLPKSFDANEIFVLLIGIIVTTAFILLPRRFTRLETILILSFNFFLASVVDRILAGDVLNFYNIMDDPKFEVMDLFIYMFVYPFFVYLVLYIYSFINHDNIVFFLLLTVMVTMGFEMLSVKLNVFQYKKWNIMYSGIAYTILYSLNVFFLKYVKVVIAKIKFRN